LNDRLLAFEKEPPLLPETRKTYFEVRDDDKPGTYGIAFYEGTTNGWRTIWKFPEPVVNPCVVVERSPGPYVGLIFTLQRSESRHAAIFSTKKRLYQWDIDRFLPGLREFSLEIQASSDGTAVLCARHRFFYEIGPKAYREIRLYFIDTRGRPRRRVDLTYPIDVESLESGGFAINTYEKSLEVLILRSDESPICRLCEFDNRPLSSPVAYLRRGTWACSSTTDERLLLWRLPTR
jgi:hypothetical protein